MKLFNIATHLKFITHLVEQIIQTFVQVVQIQQHDSATCFHAYLDLIDVATNLHIYICAGQSLLSTFILCCTEQNGCSTHLCVVLVFGEAATKQNIWLCVFTLEQESVHNFQCRIILR